MRIRGWVFLAWVGVIVLLLALAAQLGLPRLADVLWEGRDAVGFWTNLVQWFLWVTGGMVWVGAGVARWKERTSPHPPTSQQVSASGRAVQVQGNVGATTIALGAEARVGGDIVQGDNVQGDKHVHASPPPSPLPSVHQLPPPPRLKGRKKDLDQLERDLESGGVTIAGVQGAGGIGKTALALALAHKVTDRYPDGQIYLDLQGAHSQKALTVAQILRYVITSFHPETQPPEDEARLRTSFQSRLYGKRVLLLMDNARDEVQVEPLVPPPGCALIVTSRQRFSVRRLPLRDLNFLEPAAARELLQDLVKGSVSCSDADADSIAKACGCLPLALHLAAGALRAADGPSPRDYAKRLAAARGNQRLELLKGRSQEATPELADVFGLSYALVPTPLQERWCKLATFPAPFDVAAASAIWGVPEPEARTALQELHTHSLLEFNKDTKRFGLHDLMRDFADSLLSPKERAVAERAHAGHYVAVAARADELFLAGGKNVLEGLALFDAEWPHIQAGQAWAASHAKSDDEAARLCNQYPNAATYCLDLRLHARQRADWLEQAVAAARRLKLRTAEGGHLGNLGNAYADLGEVRKAITFHEQSLAISHELGNLQSEGQDLGNLGTAYAELGEFRKAVTFHEQALAISRELGDRQLECSVLGNLGNAYAELGEFRKAVTFHEQALAISHELGNLQSEGQDLGNLGNAYAELGEFRKAVTFHEQALAICRELGDRRTEGPVLGNLGAAYAELGEFRKAVTFHEQALAICRELGDRRTEGNALGNLGNAYAGLKQSKKAIGFYDQALAIAREVGDRASEAAHLFNLSDELFKVGERSRALDLMEQALNLYRAIESPVAADAARRLKEWRRGEGAK